MARLATTGSSSESSAAAQAGVVGGRLGRLDLEQHVGALVLDGLEAADGPAELDPRLGVLDRGVEHVLGPADLLGGQRHGGEVERLGEPGLGAAVGADQRGRRAGELEPGLLARLVHGRQRRAGEPGGVALHGEERDARAGAGRHEDEVGDVAVDDEHLVAVEDPAVALLWWPRSSMPAEVPLAVVLGDGQRGDRLARGDARAGRSFLASSSPEVSSALAASATVEKNGAHSRAAPISSSTTISST